MTTFEERKKAEEAKYKHNQEFLFKVTARRNKLLGLWAAAQFGLSGAEAEAYAKQVVQSDFERPGDADVVAKVLRDFEARRIEMDEHRVRRQMEKLTEEAKKQVSKE